MGTLKMVPPLASKVEQDDDLLSKGFAKLKA
jgi:hypothetical protein